MRKHKSIQKHIQIKQHRRVFYDKALDKLIAGQAPPEYVKQRWDKLKGVK